MKGFVFGAAILSALGFATNASADIVKRVYQCVPDDRQYEQSYTIECETVVGQPRDYSCGCEKGFTLVSIGEDLVPVGRVDGTDR